MASKLAFNLGLRTVTRFPAPVSRCLSCSAVRWDNAKAPQAPSQAVSTADAGGRTGLVGFMYEKTGVTGAWTLGVGASAYLCSKELYVMNGETLVAIVLGGIGYYLIRRLGKPVADFLDAKSQEILDLYENHKKKEIKVYQDDIDYNLGLEGTLAKRKDFIAVMRDLNTMELESEYNRRQQEVGVELLKRLNYHVQEEAVRRNSEHVHMISWIESQVTESLKGKQDESFDQCLNSLKKMNVTA